MDFFKKGKEEPVKKPQAQSPLQNMQQPQAQPQAASQPRDYTIKGGDTLSKIAKQYYGNANEWRRIYEANKSTISDPDKIFPGQKIIIPDKP
ncbi:MAG TPA: LysM peptidoglycan-binding domain-containing protein [Chitinophagales bacterium]|nr:LysM peptidoglycan-binding domain-containing protein [Chitinophagales bacterium]